MSTRHRSGSGLCGRLMSRDNAAPLLGHRIDSEPAELLVFLERVPCRRRGIRFVQPPLAANPLIEIAPAESPLVAAPHGRQHARGRDAAQQRVLEQAIDHLVARQPLVRVARCAVGRGGRSAHCSGPHDRKVLERGCEYAERKLQLYPQVYPCRQRTKTGGKTSIGPVGRCERRGEHRHETHSGRLAIETRDELRHDHGTPCQSALCSLTTIRSCCTGSSSCSRGSRTSKCCIAAPTAPARSMRCSRAARTCSSWTCGCPTRAASTCCARSPPGAPNAAACC